MKKIIKTLLPIASITTLAGCIAPITSCNKGNVDPKAIAGIVVTAKPTKLTYAQGEYLDLTGLEVKTITIGGEKTITTDFTSSIVDKTRLTEKGEKEVTITLNGTSHTDSFKIDVGEPIITKLEVTHAPTKQLYDRNQPLELAGLVVKSTDSMDNVDANYKDYKAQPEDGTPLSQWGRNTVTISCKTTSTTTDVLVAEAAKKWSACTWEDISDWTYCLEAGIIDEPYFAKHFLDENGNEYTQLSQFVNLNKTIKINNKDHNVKIIGINHDTIDSPDYFPQGNTKATFTFQFFNKITNESTTSPDSLKSIYSDYELQDYTDSQLRYNLDKKGTTPKDIRWTDKYENRSVFEMLPAEFENYIWPVKKSVACKARTETSFTVRTYTDRLFVPTMTEYNKQSPFSQYEYTFEIEGTPYDYWKDHGQNERKIYIVGSTSETQSYWTATPVTNRGSIFAVKPGNNDDFGTFSIGGEYAGQAIAPCFCI